ncbi:3911_t:CDS:1, partial [Gigaspora rosea]
TMMTNCGPIVNTVLQKLNTPLASFVPVFQQAYNAAYKTTSKSYILQHPAHPLFRTAQIYNPR